MAIDAESVQQALDSIQSTGEPGAFMYCAANADGEAQLIVDAERIAPMVTLKILRSAKDRALVTGQVMWSPRRGRFEFVTEKADHPTFADHLKALFGDAVAALAEARVRTEEDEEEDAEDSAEEEPSEDDDSEGGGAGDEEQDEEAADDEAEAEEEEEEEEKEEEEEEPAPPPPKARAGFKRGSMFAGEDEAPAAAPPAKAPAAVAADRGPRPVVELLAALEFAGRPFRFLYAPKGPKGGPVLRIEEGAMPGTAAAAALAATGALTTLEGELRWSEGAPLFVAELSSFVADLRGPLAADASALAVARFEGLPEGAGGGGDALAALEKAIQAVPAARSELARLQAASARDKELAGQAAAVDGKVRAARSALLDLGPKMGATPDSLLRKGAEKALDALLPAAKEALPVACRRTKVQSGAVGAKEKLLSMLHEASARGEALGEAWSAVEGAGIDLPWLQWIPAHAGSAPPDEPGAILQGLPDTLAALDKAIRAWKMSARSKPYEDAVPQVFPTEALADWPRALATLDEAAAATHVEGAAGCREGVLKVVDAAMDAQKQARSWLQWKSSMPADQQACLDRNVKTLDALLVGCCRALAGLAGAAG